MNAISKILNTATCNVFVFNEFVFCVESNYIVVNAITFCDFIFYCVTVPLKSTLRYRNLHCDFGGQIAHHFVVLYSNK